MKLRSILIAGVLALAAAAEPAPAHHSFAANYVVDQRVTINGTVTRFDYRSPHSLLYVDVKAADGSNQSWLIEFGSALILKKLGFNAETFKVGDVVEAIGMPARTGAPRMNVTEVRRAADKFEYKAKP